MTSKTLIGIDYSAPDIFKGMFDTVMRLDTHKAWDLARAGRLGKDTYLLFGGGTDVNPMMYDEPRHPRTQDPDHKRDFMEANLFYRCVGRIGGMIGVCRGAQLLTVLSGGKLIQHLHLSLFHACDHLITRIDTGETVQATSTHHQMMYPFSLKENEYEILAVAKGDPDIRSHQMYKDGWDNPITNVPVEPEIVYYPTTNALAIQGHPEYLRDDDPYVLLCNTLIKERLFKDD